MGKIRGFEIVSKYEGEGINKPVRKTQLSAGYDFEASKTVTIPSIWRQAFSFITESNAETYDDIMDYAKQELKTMSLKDLMKKYKLKPTLVPTGIKAYMLDDEYLQLSNRSSGALKKGLIMSNGIGIIDADYVDNPDNEGEIFFQFINFLPFDVTIEKHEAIGQGIFKKYLLTGDDEATGERLGGHGSTDEENK